MSLERKREGERETDVTGGEGQLALDLFAVCVLSV